MLKLLYLSVLSLALTACSMDDLPKYSKLDRLRILALDVDQPEIQNPAGGVTNVQLTPYVSDVGGTGTINLAVQSCLDPGVGLGAEPSCDGAQFASTVQNVTVSDAGGAPVDTFGNPERTGKPLSGAITVGLTIPAGLLAQYSAALQNNGVAYLITVTATRGSDVVRSFRRVLLSTKTPNTNPVLSDLLANGASLTALPTGEASLTFAAGSAPESYTFVGGNGSETLTETFETTWFVADGNIDNPRTQTGESTVWESPGSAPSGRQAVVVGVLRDGRGGTSVLIRKF